MKSFLRKKQKLLSKPIASNSKLSTSAERLHIQAHLALTELRLLLTKRSCAERQITLSNLHGYWRNGVFPKNTRRPGLRTPIFIDENGTYCAVGSLMASSRDDSLAHKINKTNTFVIVEELEGDEVAAWLKHTGITKEEAALIQPGYGFTLEQVGSNAGYKVKAAATIVCMALIIILVTALIRMIVKRPHSISFKKNAFAVTVGLITLGISLVFLPRPSLALNTLTSKNHVVMTIGCQTINGTDGKWNDDPEYDKICKSYDNDPSKTPGWRNPCMDDGSENKDYVLDSQCIL